MTHIQAALEEVFQAPHIQVSYNFQQWKNLFLLILGFEKINLEMWTWIGKNAPGNIVFVFTVLFKV